MYSYTSKTVSWPSGAGCCIYHKPRKFGESSDSDSDDDCCGGGGGAGGGSGGGGGGGGAGGADGKGHSHAAKHHGHPHSETEHCRGHTNRCYRASNDQQRDAGGPGASASGAQGGSTVPSAWIGCALYCECMTVAFCVLRTNRNIAGLVSCKP